MKVTRRVAEVAGKGSLAGRKILAVDATGVGMPVVEMLAAERPGCEVRPVMLTAAWRNTMTGGCGTCRRWI